MDCRIGLFLGKFGLCECSIHRFYLVQSIIGCANLITIVGGCEMHSTVVMIDACCFLLGAIKF